MFGHFEVLVLLCLEGSNMLGDAREAALANHEADQALRQSRKITDVLCVGAWVVAG